MYLRKVVRSYILRFLLPRIIHRCKEILARRGGRTFLNRREREGTRGEGGCVHPDGAENERRREREEKDDGSCGSRRTRVAGRTRGKLDGSAAREKEGEGSEGWEQKPEEKEEAVGMGRPHEGGPRGGVTS